MRRIVFMSAALVGAVVYALVPATVAGAYGNSGGKHQTYQLTFSQNCNNPDFCGADQLGGFWGWAVLYSNGTGEAELTFCGHQAGVGGGAGHIHDDFTYDLSNTTELVTLQETQTVVGPNGGTFVVPGSDTGIPLTPGHYSTDELLGFPAPPGVSFQIQVVALH